MNLEIYIPLIIGIIITVFGIGTFINQNLGRFIRLPGSIQIKAFISIVIGIIFIIIGLYSIIQS